MRRLLLGVLVAIIVAIVLTKLNKQPESVANAPEGNMQEQTLGTKVSVASAAMVAQLKKDIAEHEASTFTPDQLVNAYAANKVRADKTYKNQKIYVEGKVERIEKDALGKPYMLFNSKDEIRTVQAYLFNDAAASLLTKGQKVTLQGTCKGFVLANVVLTDASEASSLSSLRDNLKNSQ